MKVALWDDQDALVARLDAAAGHDANVIAEVPATTVLKWRKAIAAYEAAQKEMLAVIQEREGK